MRTIDDLDVYGRRVLVRADLNVPLSGDYIADDGRVQASLPTLRALVDRGARVVVCSHLGRPGGVPDPRYSLAPVAARLGRLLDRGVRLTADTVGPSARAAMASVYPGGVAMLENLRFCPGETSSEAAEREEFAGELAELADLYVGDGFGVLHRRHASVRETALRLPHAAGYLVAAELRALSLLAGEVARPYVLVLGGAKVGEKLGVISALLGRADVVLVGGAMAGPFLAAAGHADGEDAGLTATAAEYLDRSERAGTRIILPADLVAAARPARDSLCRVVRPGGVPPGWSGLDIGPETARIFASRIAGAGTVLWNGPMGMYELPPFAAGTATVARAVAGSRAFTVVSGGDTTAAVRSLEFPESAFGHLCTGGGASLEYLEGQELPGLAALRAPDPAGPRSALAATG